MLDFLTFLEIVDCSICLSFVFLDKFEKEILNTLLRDFYCEVILCKD